MRFHCCIHGYVHVISRMSASIVTLKHEVSSSSEYSTECQPSSWARWWVKYWELKLMARTVFYLFGYSCITYTHTQQDKVSLLLEYLNMQNCQSSEKLVEFFIHIFILDRTIWCTICWWRWACCLVLFEVESWVKRKKFIYNQCFWSASCNDKLSRPLDYWHAGFVKPWFFSLSCYANSNTWASYKCCKISSMHRTVPVYPEGGSSKCLRNM